MVRYQMPLTFKLELKNSVNYFGGTGISSSACRYLDPIQHLIDSQYQQCRSPSFKQCLILVKIALLPFPLLLFDTPFDKADKVPLSNTELFPIWFEVRKFSRMDKGIYGFLVYLQIVCYIINSEDAA